MHMAEQKSELVRPGDHALGPSYVNAAWTLNRFPVHSTTKISPFELVFGGPTKDELLALEKQFYFFIDVDSTASMDRSGFQVNKKKRARTDWGPSEACLEQGEVDP